VGTLVNNDRYPLLLIGFLVIFVAATQGAVADEGNSGTVPAWLVTGDSSGRELPAGLKVERYAHLWERNPFNMPSAAPIERSPSVFDDLYLISWLNDAGKVVIHVQNSQTNEVQRIAAKPNSNNLRLVGIRLNSNPRLVTAVIASGQEQGTVKVRFEPEVIPEGTSLTLTTNGTDPSSSQTPAPAIRASRLYPGLPKVRSEGDRTSVDKHSKFAPKVNGPVPGQS
jgi:hypothetical protein